MNKLDLQAIQTFLQELQAHNEVAWMQAHKPAYAQAKAEFEALVQALLQHMAAFDPALSDLDPHALIGRLNRDTRFSSDKSPYRTSFRVHLSPAGNKPIPVGYFLSLEPDGGMLGGGLFASIFPDATRRIRDALTAQPSEAAAALRVLQEAGLSVHGEALKRVPAGYPTDHPLSDLLRNKSWYIETEVPFPTSENLEAWLTQASAAFAAMKPFHGFLNQALEGFTFPERK